MLYALCYSRGIPSCRKLDKERQEKYQQELEEMKRRLETRPLLFKQASLDLARRSAEAKYVATLRKAGLSDEEIQSLNQVPPKLDGWPRPVDVEQQEDTGT